MKLVSFAHLSLVIATLSVTKPGLALLNYELVSPPTSAGFGGQVFRALVRRDGDKVLYGECDVLESKCTSDSKSLVIRRQMPYTEYQARIAQLFTLAPSLLLNDQEAETSIQATVLLLRAVIDDPNRSDEEKSEAGKRFNALTETGGIRDRLLQAVAIKHQLEPGDDVSLLEGERLYKTVLRPFDFMADLDSKDPLTLREISTGKTWKFGGTDLVLQNARGVCATGYRLPTEEEILYAAPWLHGSTIGAKFPSTKGKYSGWPEKKLWLADLESELVERSEWVEGLYGRRYENKYNERVWYAKYVYLRATGTRVLKEKLDGKDEANTSPISAVCVKNRQW